MLKPEVSIPAGLATAAVVYGVYSNALPNAADIRTAPPQNTDVDAARKQAAWTSAAVVGAVSLMAGDPTIFVIGGAVLVALDWMTRHADAVNPITGKVDGILRRNAQGQPTQAAADDAYGPELAAV